MTARARIAFTPRQITGAGVTEAKEMIPRASTDSLVAAFYWERSNGNRRTIIQAIDRELRHRSDAGNLCELCHEFVELTDDGACVQCGKEMIPRASTDSLVAAFYWERSNGNRRTIIQAIDRELRHRSDAGNLCELCHEFVELTDDGACVQCGLVL